MSARGEIFAKVELLAAVRALDVVVTSADEEWLRDRFVTEVLAGKDAENVGVETATNLRVGEDLPANIAAYRIDGIPVLLGALRDRTRRAVQDEVRRYRNQAMIARAWLGKEAANLQLFLIGPLGSMDDMLWRQLAEEVEIDDRVCRKLVWLPSDAPKIEDAAYFLQRTFLARPWADALRPRRLDRLRELALPEGWDAIVRDSSLTPDQLIAAIIKSTPLPEDS
ncbi:hypothetical protein EGM87_22170 [Sphingobium sp. RSMS]|nr:ABC-three component system middle component 1 [Sphingobium sp. RSMS]UXC93006.1 hypothetical protein EGM87_22170 [Sphingobium sp. RSMS]